MSRKRLIQVFGVVAALGAIAGVLAATGFAKLMNGGAPPVSALDQAITSAPTFTAATFPSAIANAAPTGGRAVGHAVTLQRLSGLNLVCMWDQASDGSERAGGCNGAGNPLAGKKVWISTTSSTGANGVGYQAIRVAGLAAPNVASVVVQMSDGSTRTVPLEGGVPTSVSGGPTAAFAYAEDSSDLSAGLIPESVAALNGGGHQLDVIPVGLAG